jgi:hypothetical protein
MDIRNSFVNYQQRKSRLNQLYIELLFNRTIAENNSKIKGDPGWVCLYKFKLSVFDSILSDSYYIFDGDKELYKFYIY